MWIYQKCLQYPVKIKCKDPRMAGIIVAQYGGPDGEIGASLRYLSQRYTMPINEAKAVLNDIGTEEMAHYEMVGTMVYQLLKNATPEEIKRAGAEAYYVGHGCGVYPQSAAGVPFSAGCFQSKGNAVADLTEDLAAEEKARTTYEYLIRLSDDPDVTAPLKFLRQREVVHFQRFGETLMKVQEYMDSKKYY